MNVILSYMLKILRRGYCWMFPLKKDVLIVNDEIKNTVSDLIRSSLESDKPCMIARFGANELSAMLNCLSVKSSRHNFINYIRGREEQWWWNKNIIRQMQQNAGFFPTNPESISKFTDLMLNDLKQLDILAYWIGSEKKLPLPQNCKYIHLLTLEPYWSSKPWSKALDGKKVVVVHPFAELIEHQYYNHRTELFDKPDVLPVFNLRTVKAVQSIGGDCNEFKNWFDALLWMEREIDKEDYDICLIGCGAYGFPLAAHCKRHGKKAVHMGGALQLLFGIKGRRWENPDYCKIWGMKPENLYLKMLSNKCWVRPDNYRTEKSQKVEDACYW